MIGRKEEKEYLLSLLEEEESQFVAVFGRRRVGKTYLVRETFNHRFTFQHTGLQTLTKRLKKYGTFAPKVRRFCPKSTELSVAKFRCFSDNVPRPPSPPQNTRRKTHGFRHRGNRRQQHPSIGPKRE